MMTATEQEQIMVMHNDRVRVSDIRKKNFLAFGRSIDER